MNRYHPNPAASISISLQLQQQLTAATIHSDFTKEDWEITAEALDEWMRRHAPEALLMQTISGYQWKRLFLPEGTLLRTVFGGKNYNCLVEGDRILYKGQAVSPSGFVNAVGGIRRNAWRCTWILFPKSADWKLADTLRTRERPHRVRARKPTDSIEQTSPRQPAGVPSVSGPPSVKSESIAADAAHPPGLAPATHGQEQQPDPTNETTGKTSDSQRHASVTRSPPLRPPGTERRANADGRIVALLRQELLPLLYRLCAFDGMPVGTRASPAA